MNVYGKWNVFNEKGHELILGAGGSGKVFKCYDNENNKYYAFKICKKNSDIDRKKRFKIEIETNKLIMGKENIYKTVPMIDYDNENYNWYVSDLGSPSMTYLKINNIDSLDILSMYINFLKGIQKLHQYGISHRDIKPDNILLYNNEFRVIDFGIVKNQRMKEFTDITINNVKDRYNLGAKFTMAPEMRRNPATADPFKADIYSLLKTLWMFISKNETGFDGQYNKQNHSLYDYFKKFGKVSNLSILDDILLRGTNDFPDKRCNIDEFIDAIDHIVWSNSDINKGLGKDLYLSRTHSLENLNKYIPNFYYFNSMNLNKDFISVICNLINSCTFTFTQSSFKNVKYIDSMKIINHEYFILGNDTKFTNYLNIKDIENIFLLNESGIPFTIFIKMIDEYVILICDNEMSNDFVFNNKNLYIPKKYLKNLCSLKKYLYRKALS